MSYRGLGSRRAVSEADQSGLNAGNWTTHFLSSDIAVKVAWFEVYRAVAENVPAGVPLRVTIGDRAVSFTVIGVGGEWDPTQPPLLQPGQDLYFLWGVAATGTPPEVTIWLRHEE